MWKIRKEKGNTVHKKENINASPEDLPLSGTDSKGRESFHSGHVSETQ